jgi:hypothetical protein
MKNKNKIVMMCYAMRAVRIGAYVCKGPYMYYKNIRVLLIGWRDGSGWARLAGIRGGESSTHAKFGTLLNTPKYPPQGCLRLRLFSFFTVGYWVGVRWHGCHAESHTPGQSSISRGRIQVFAKTGFFEFRYPLHKDLFQRKMNKNSINNKFF